jgi:hypothetical protein
MLWVGISIPTVVFPIPKCEFHAAYGAGLDVTVGLPLGKGVFRRRALTLARLTWPIVNCEVDDVCRS